MVDLFREKKWDLVGRRGLWFIIMAITIIISIGALIFRWQTTGQALNRGIDFTGGGIVYMGIEPAVSLGEEAAKTQQIRDALEAAGLRVQVQMTSHQVGVPRDQVIVRTQLTESEEDPEAAGEELNKQSATIQDVLTSKLGFQNVEQLDSERVSAVVSDELKSRAILALIFGCLAIVAWIFVRYDFGTTLVPKYGICAIIALAHDLIVLVGAFAIVWWVVDSPFVAAFLTILGYSVHDTIIIFDRIRENVKLRKRPTFPETVNLSLLETMARSVNTVLTVEFVLIALYAFGGSTLRGFAGALIIGVTSGAWSSIFIASQLLVAWKKREERGKVAPVPAKAAKAVLQPAARKAAAPVNKPVAPTAAAPVESGVSRTEEAEEGVAASTATGAHAAKKLRGKKRHRRF